MSRTLETKTGMRPVEQEHELFALLTHGRACQTQYLNFSSTKLESIATPAHATVICFEE